MGKEIHTEIAGITSLLTRLTDFKEILDFR